MVANRSIYSTRSSDWAASFLADNSQIVGAGSGQFVSAPLALGTSELAPQSPPIPIALPASDYSVDLRPLIDSAVMHTASALPAGDLAALDSGRPSREWSVSVDLIAEADQSALTDGALTDLVLAAPNLKLSLAEALPLTATERLALTATGDLLSTETIDVMGACFLLPGADPFKLNSFLLVDTDSDGIDEFVIHLDNQGPILMGTDFLI